MGLWNIMGTEFTHLTPRVNSLKRNNWFLVTNTRQFLELKTQSDLTKPYKKPGSSHSFLMWDGTHPQRIPREFYAEGILGMQEYFWTTSNYNLERYLIPKLELWRVSELESLFSIASYCVKDLMFLLAKNKTFCWIRTSPDRMVSCLIMGEFKKVVSLK